MFPFTKYDAFNKDFVVFRFDGINSKHFDTISIKSIGQ